MLSRALIVALVLTSVALFVRLPGAGSFMTADEPNWMLRSADFWHQLVREHDPGGTFITTHPGVPTLWLAGAGISLQEARLGFDIDTSNLRSFRQAAVLPVVTATALLIGLLGYLAVTVLGVVRGGMAALAVAVMPYLTGVSQIAHLDALQSLFMLTGFLAFWQFLQHGRWRTLTLAALLTGLALATKFVIGIWLPVMFTAVLLWRVCQRQENLSRVIAVLGFGAGVAALTVYLLWPALWVKVDLSHSFERDIPLVVTQEHIATDSVVDPITPATFYLRTILGRISIPEQIILLAILGLFWWPLLWGRKLRDRSLGVWLLVYSIGFLVVLTLAAKKADRYALPALATLEFLAGWVGAATVQRLLQYQNMAKRVQVGIGSIIAGSLMIVPLLLAPYAIAYTNPLFSSVLPLSQQGWGEGLDAAAAWLNQRPRAAEMYVASWYPDVLGTYFLGKTLSLSSRTDDRVQYLVVYRNMGDREQDSTASNVLDEVRDRTPVYTVTIQGVPYVAIYQQDSVQVYNRHIGELTGQIEVGQTVIPAANNWSEIDIVFATFSSRANTHEVVMDIYEDSDAVDPIRSSRVNAAAITDNAWQHFTFDPIEVSIGKTYYVTITSPESIPGNAVTVRYTDVDVRPGQMLLRHDGVTPRSASLQSGDIAYRLP